MSAFNFLEALSKLDDVHLKQLCQKKALELTEGSFVRLALLVYGIYTSSPAIIVLASKIPKEYDTHEKFYQYASLILATLDKPAVSRRFVDKLLEFYTLASEGGDLNDETEELEKFFKGT